MIHAAIVGGGISGLAAAVALRAAGHAVDVFERAPEIREVGSGITLWSNATRALRQLGVLEACAQRSCAIRAFDLRTAAGRQLMTIPIERFATDAVAMHRCDLQAALLGALPPSVLHKGAACLGVREDARGVFLRFEGGERGPFSLAIGADGLHSAVRRYVTGAGDPPRYRGYFVWRGVAFAALPFHPAGRISETWGRGNRFGILPLGGGRVCWYATANVPLEATSAPEDRHDRLSRLIAGWHAPIPELLAATPAGAILENPALDRGLVRGWRRGSALIIGDAAHPITPNLGQGGCMALEDAVVLGTLLQGVAADACAIGAALARFEALRFPRLRAMERRCRWLGALGQWQNPAVTLVRNRVARLIPGAYFVHTSRIIQSYAADQVAARGAPRLTPTPGYPGPP